MSEEDEYLKKLRMKKMQELLTRKLDSFPANGTVYELNINAFSQIIQSSMPVLIDFWAEWCMPCKYMHPIIERLAKKYVGKVKFARLNVDNYSEIAQQYGIMGIPTFLIFRKGSVVDRIVGAVGQGPLERAILRIIS
ncbi:MAG: thioredoxin [Candidatus Asgardarchaeia archaeon]